jgi:hypothetical protein
MAIKSILPIYYQLLIKGVLVTEVLVDGACIRYNSCIGKKHGYTCSTCLMKSWCDGIPIREIYSTD